MTSIDYLKDKKWQCFLYHILMVKDIFDFHDVQQSFPTETGASVITGGSQKLEIFFFCVVNYIFVFIRSTCKSTRA